MKTGYRRHEELVKILKTLIFMAIGVTFLLPLLWMISSSLKTPAEVFQQDFHWLPEVPRWDNYKEVWSDSEVTMAQGYLNSIYITFFSIVFKLFFASLAAYAFAKIDFKGRGVIFMIFLSTMMIPTEVTLIPRFMLFKELGLYNSRWAIGPAQ